MQIVESFLTENPCYKQGKKLNVQGLMLHSVGCAQPNASVFVKNWNKESYSRACVHGFIDANDGKVYQCLPWDMRGWHGGGASNNTHIGVEMCEPSAIKYPASGVKFAVTDENLAMQQATRTYNTAVELFAMLCQKFDLNPLECGVILSHKEGYKFGIASNHGDPEHLWEGLGLPYTMDTFRKDVAKKMGNVSIVIEAPKTEEKPVDFNKLQPSQYKNMELSGTYIALDDLNIRKGAGTEFAIMTTIPIGKKCKCYGFYNLKGQTKWLCVSYDGVTGYASGKYLEKVK